MCALCLYVYKHGANEGQKRVLELLELHLQVVGNNPSMGTGNKLLLPPL